MSNNKPLRLPIELFDFPDAGEYCLYCLPRVGADALLSMSHRLLWDIFTDADGKKESLTPEQKQYFEDTIEGLIMPCTFPDYSQQLSDIAVALSQIQITANCTPDITVTCGSDSNFIVYPDPSSPPIVNPGPLPDTPIDPDNPIPYPPDFPQDPLDPEGDPPAGWETWESYDADACAAANAIVEYAYQYARQNKDFFGQDVYTIAAIIVVIVNILTLGFAVLFSRALIVKIGEVIWKMANWLPLEAAEEFFQDMENYIQANRQDLVCTLYEARLSGSDGMNNFLASIFGFASGTAAYIADASLVTELLGYIFPPSLFAGSIVGGIAYSGENSLSCESCGEPVLSDLYLRDWSGTLGQLYVSTDGGLTYVRYGNTGAPLYFGLEYYLKGDGAFHMDCQITDGPLGPPAYPLATFSCQTVGAITVECMAEGEIPFTTGATASVRTSRLDSGGNFRYMVVTFSE